MGTGWYYLYKALNKSNSSSKSKSSGDIYIDGSSNIYRKLLTAIIYDDFVGVQRLLNKPQDSKAKENCFGEPEDVSPLCIAIEGERWNMVNLLSSYASDFQKQKAYCDAAAYNDVNMMKYIAKNILKDVEPMHKVYNKSIDLVSSTINTLIDCKKNGQFDDISGTIELLCTDLGMSNGQIVENVIKKLVENNDIETLKNLSDAGNNAATYYALKLAAETDDIQSAKQLIYKAKGNFEEFVDRYNREKSIINHIKSFEMLDLLLPTDCITREDSYYDYKDNSYNKGKFRDIFIQGDTAKLQKFIKKHIKKISSLDDTELFDTMIDTAIELKDFESLKYIIKNNMLGRYEIELQTKDGLKYDWETTKFFMDNGIKPSLHEFDCDIKMLNYMKKNYLIDEKNIEEAISGASFENVKYLIDNGYKDKVLSKFDIAAYNYNIHSSSSDERRIIVECLIKQGALDLDVNKNADITAKCQEMLKTALLNKDAKVAALLSERGFKLSDCKLSDEESKKLNENLRKSLLDGNLEYARISIKQGVKLYDKKILKDMYYVTKRKCKKEIKQARKIIIKNKLTKKESEDYKKLKAEKNAKIKKHTEVR